MCERNRYVKMSLKNYIFTSINVKPLEAEDFANNFTIRVKKQRDTRKLSQIGEAMERDAKLSQSAASGSSPPPHQPPSASEFERLRRTINTTDDIGWFKKIMKLWSYVSVEPVMVCWYVSMCYKKKKNTNLKNFKASLSKCYINYNYISNISTGCCHRVYYWLPLRI